MNLRTLDDFKKDTQKDPKKKNTTSYAGGESSGMSVENPDIKEILSKAEQKSQTPEEYGEKERSNNGTVFKITLYSNGFIVDDGEFQDNSLPESKKFMKELNEGYVPKSLRAQSKGSVSISLVDKTKQAYEPPPPPAYVKFSGSGVSMSSAPVTGPALDVNSNFLIEPKKNEEVVQMRLRLQDGSCIVVEANPSTNLMDLYRHVATVTSISKFELLEGFPPQIVNRKGTVGERELAGSTLILKK